MFLSQMRAFIMHWLLQLDFSAPKKKKKKKKKQKKTKNERGNEIVQELNIEDS